MVWFASELLELEKVDLTFHDACSEYWTILFSESQIRSRSFVKIMSQIRSLSFFFSFSENEPRSDHDLDQIISRSFSEFSFSLFGNVKTYFSIKMVHYLIINFQHFQTKGTICFIFSSKNNSGFNFLFALIKNIIWEFKKTQFLDQRLGCIVSKMIGKDLI